MIALNTSSTTASVIQVNPIRQLRNNPTSRAAAIKAKCAECVGCSLDHLEKGFRVSISECSSYSCQLHSLRPFRPKTTSK